MKRTFLTAAICLLAACTDGGQQPGAPLNASRNGEAAFEATEGTTVRLEEYLHVTGGVPPYGYATSLQGDFAPSLEPVSYTHLNDAKKSDPKRYTDPETTFKENLRRFVNEARGKGATPILATSIVRRQFGKDGTLRDSHGRYVPAAAEVAAELNVPLVDMNRLTGELVLKYGPEESKKLYLYVEPNVAERFPDGNADDTHLCIRGAEEFAALFTEACAAANNPLGRYVKPNPAR